MNPATLLTQEKSMLVRTQRSRGCGPSAQKPRSAIGALACRGSAANIYISILYIYIYIQYTYIIVYCTYIHTHIHTHILNITLTDHSHVVGGEGEVCLSSILPATSLALSSCYFCLFLSSSLPPSLPLSLDSLYGKFNMDQGRLTFLKIGLLLLFASLLPYRLCRPYL